MNELEVRHTLPEPFQPGREGRRRLRWVFAALVALLGMGGAWTAWAQKQQENAALRQSLEQQQQRQEEALQEVLRQLASVRAELAAQPKQTLLLDEPTPVVRPYVPPPRPLAPLLKDDAKPEKPPKRGVAKFLTSSIFIDSAVLTSSLLVPPSLPLTLAQSRLGRRLTGRILKKTHTDKTVAAKVIRDVEDMPITKKRRR